MGFVLYPPTKEYPLLLARIGLVATLSLPFGMHEASSQRVEVTTTTTIVSTTVHAQSIITMHPELQAQLKTRKAGSVKFWEAISWCEVNHDWKNGGYFSGGLGMAQSVWVNYGGKQFASRPPKATKEEQIIVANRVAFFGFQTKNVYRTLEDRENNNPYFRPAVGWRNMKNWGRGCVNWETRKPLRDRYTEAGIIEWKKSRGKS
jgi:hypothetical protein